MKKTEVNYDVNEVKRRPLATLVHESENQLTIKRFDSVDIRDRLTAAACVYFPDLPMVGQRRGFYLQKDGFIANCSFASFSVNDIGVKAEVFDDNGYLAIKLDFYNC